MQIPQKATAIEKAEETIFMTDRIISRGATARECSSSCEHPVNDFAVHVGQPPVRAIVAEGELLVIDSKEMQHGCVEVVNRHGVTRGLPRPFVALAVGDAALHTGTSHPAGEGAAIVIAAVAAL